MTKAKDEIDSELIVCGPQNTARLTVCLTAPDSQCVLKTARGQCQQLT